MKWRAEEPTDIDALDFLRERDDVLVTLSLYNLARREAVDALVSWLDAQPPIPPSWFAGSRLALVLRLRLDGYTLEAIAKKIGRSAEQVRAMEHAGLERLRRHFAPHQ
jgi:DNA-directed RNA polymerase sigma subunit (sigma70/sigma32)